MGRFFIFLLAAAWTISAAAHPLEGRIFLPANGAFITPDELLARAARAEAVLLGETHDNPTHHALQAWVVENLAAGGSKPTVVFEMIGADQAEALARHLDTGGADGIGPALGWENSGWPDWAFYRPIAQAAGTRVKAGNLSKEETRAISRGTPAPELVARLGLAQPLPDETDTAMSAEIRESHCNMLPNGAVPAMVAVQRARDATMALALAEVEGVAVLIAGSGHVRTDFAVPWHLAGKKPSVAIAFLEVEDGADAPEEYRRHYGGHPLPFDAVWFTPRAPREDPCQAFAERLKSRR